MSQSILHQQVAEKRRDFAPMVTAIEDRISTTRSFLNQLLQSCVTEDAKHWKSVVGKLDIEADDLGREIHSMRQRFESGMVKIAIGGLEKAGKTTFLRTLTKINQLPAFDERCTAVPCEIIYSENRQEAEMDFFSEKQFMGRVIGRLTDTVATGISDIGKKSALGTKSFSSLDSFINYALPSESLVTRGGAAAIALTTLKLLQTEASRLNQYLGKLEATKVPLDQLTDWIAHTAIEDTRLEGDAVDKIVRQLTISRCRVYTSYQNGEEIVRLIDTPGVDDPSPRARLQTLDIIGEEADVLLVLGRPLNPSPTAPIIDFIDLVKNLPQSHPARELILYGFNTDRRILDHIQVIEKHMRLLLRDHEIPESKLLQPVDVTDEDQVYRLMDDLNAFLAQALPQKDQATVLALEDRVASLEARIRVDLIEPMGSDLPSDPSLDSTRYNLFNGWFDSFWKDMREGIVSGLKSIEENEDIKIAQSRLREVFEQEVEAIDSKSPAPEDVRFTQEVAESSPVEVFMRDNLAPLMGDFINTITQEIEAFGPIVQEKVCGVLEAAGLSPLLKGPSHAEKLLALAETVDRAVPSSRIAEKLVELAQADSNLKMIFRWELRPAVDYFVPHYWRGNRAPDALRSMIEGFRGDPARLRDLPGGRLPSIQSSQEEQMDAINILVFNAVVGIDEALKNERFKLSNIAHDILSDCRTTFCFGPKKDKEWSKALYGHAHLLIPSLGQLEQRSEFFRKLRKLLDDLSSHISTKY